MTKISHFSLLSLCAISLLSCSGFKRHPSVDAKIAKTQGEIIDLNDQDILLKRPRTGEYTHEMAEANPDDNEIKKELGANAIDEELPGSESDDIPYARNFLKNKKTKRMQFWVEYFTKKNRDRFQRFINNGEEYRHHIEQVFQQYGLPTELYFVGLIESGYYLGAKSHASAVGPWQFIRATGRRYGMKINHEIDERQDLFKSTHAAAQYFRDLNKIFSSWELALAAYNAGENGIIRRILKHGTRDFYKLSERKLIPSETINYVPKVLAAMHILKNAKEYGFTVPEKKQRLFDLTELTPVKRNTSLQVIAERLKVDPRLLKKLNPEIKRGKTPLNFAGTYMLRIPKAQYAHHLVDLRNVSIATSNTSNRIGRPESRKELNRRTASNGSHSHKFHKVKKGETLLTISRKYKIPAKDLALLNDLKSWKTKIKVGQKIALQEQKLTANFSKIKITNRPIIYKVTKGDNLKEISKVFNSPINKIKKANNLTKGKILVGQKLVLPNTQKAIYTVQQGDHLTKVAKDFNLPIDTIVKLNSLKRRTIYPGQKIIVNMD